MDLKAIRQQCRSCGSAETYVEVPGSTCPKHGAFLVAESALQADPSDRNLGRVLSDNYLIFDRIGRGGMGSVYQAVHLNLKRIVALKLINTKGIDPEDLELLKGRFEFEARSLSSVSHRNVLTVYDYGVSEGDCYMVLEYIAGQTVSELLKQHGALPFQQSITLVNQLLDALTEVHERGLVHRDIKPSNLMLTEKDGQSRLVLIDFGVAKAKNTKTGDFQRDLTRTGMAVGTPRYMAPEVLQGETLGPWSDLYAVGVLLYQMLAGHVPFRGSAADVITAHLRDPIPALPSELDLPEMDKILNKAMAKEPSERYSTATHFRQALSWVAQSSMGKNARLETQIFGPGQSSVELSPSSSTASLSSPPSSSSLSSPRVKPLKSTNSIPVEEKSNPFSSAITEPHRLTSEFGERLGSTHNGVVRKKSSRRLWLQLLLLTLLGGVGLTFFLESPAKPKREIEAQRTRTMPVPHESTRVDDSIDASQGQKDRADVQAKSPAIASDATIQQVKKDAATVSTQVKESDKPKPKPKLTTIRKPKRTSMSKRPRRVVKKKIPKPKKVVVQRAKPEDSQPPEARRLTSKDIENRLVRHFNSQIDSCACDQSKLTIAQVEELSMATAKALLVRWAEACGVMGEGCRR